MASDTADQEGLARARRAKEVFLGACERSAAERDAYLEKTKDA